MVSKHTYCGLGRAGVNYTFNWSILRLSVPYSSHHSKQQLVKRSRNEYAGEILQISCASLYALCLFHITQLLSESRTISHLLRPSQILILGSGFVR